MARRARQIAVWLLMVIAITISQSVIHRWRGDPHQFTRLADEGSHFLTGLMIRDYALHGFPGNPIRFAKEYYLHYPKIAFGSWPPLLHFCVGAWMVVFPPTRDSALWYIDLLTAVLAASCAVMARHELPALLVAAVVLGFWLAPTTQLSDQAVQADTQYALLSWLCVYLFAAYLDRPSGWRAAAFGIALFGAEMTKNNALFLAVSLPVAALLMKRWRAAVRSREAWLAAIPAVIAVAVWQYLTLPFVRNNLKGVTEESTPGIALLTYAGQLAALVWIGLLPFVLWGLYRRVWIPLKLGKAVSWRDSAAFALLIGPCLFHAMLPHDVNQRYLLPSLPSLLIFGAYGLLDALSLPVFRRVARPVGMAVAAAWIAVPAIAHPIAPQPSYGYADLAAWLTAAYPAGKAPSILVVSSFTGEAEVVTEMAIREQRPGHWLLRGTKILQRRRGKLNRDLEMVDTSPAEMSEYLANLPVNLLVLADDGEAVPADYARTLIRQSPDRFRLIHQSAIGAACHDAPCTIAVYELIGTRPGPFAPDKLPPNMWLWQGL